MEITKNMAQENFEIVLNSKTLDRNTYNLVEFKMNSEVNKHTELYMKFIIKKDHENDWQFGRHESGTTSIDIGSEITVLLNERKYFSGIVQWGGTCEEYDDGIGVEASVFSKSEGMDRDINFRVYQNSSIKYIDIINDLLSRNKFINIVGINGNNGEKSGLLNENLYKSIKKKIVIQFFETDWQFLIRIMSQIGLGVFNTENGAITLGFSKDISINKKWELKHGNVKRLFDKYFTVFHKLESSDFYLLGDNVEEENKRNFGYITKAEINYSEDKFYGEYELRPYEYTYKYLVNENISNSTIEARIVGVPGNDGSEDIAIMAVNFSNGIFKTVEENKWNQEAHQKLNAFNDMINCQGKENYFIVPYNTPYSQTNTGYFCTPELNDNVLVRFKNNEESSAYVSGVINNSGNGRFSNPDVRNYTLPIEKKGKAYFEFRLNYDKFNMYAKKLIDMVTDVDFKLTSNDTMSMRSVNEYMMHVDENMSISAKNLLVSATDSKEMISAKKLEIITTLNAKYDNSYNIQTKILDSYVSNANYLQSPEIAKKS
ncbi:MAG: phage late control D family protein [Methanobrevibacter sp.]|jgi:hypothetical protein|nr:phage late control D family protein [Candidatus Methanovirga meridionalis]